MFTKVIAAALAATVAVSAHAVTYTAPINSSPVDPFTMANGETVLVDFNGLFPPAPGYALSGNYGIASNTTGDHAEPAGDTSNYFYTSSAIPGGIATLTTPDLSTVSFYWGSIDTYNTVDILGAGGASIFTLNGGQLPPADGNQGAAASNRRVYFTAGAGEVITGLKFTSTGVAFEIDDVAGSFALGGGGDPNGTVPEPASWVMLIAGFGMVGVASRRRRMTREVAA